MNYEEKISAELDRITDEAVLRISKSAEKAEKSAIKELIRALNKLNTKNGTLGTAENFRKIASLSNLFRDAVYNDQFKGELALLAEDFRKLTAVSNGYFTIMGSPAEPTDLIKALQQASAQSVVDAITDASLENNLLSTVLTDGFSNNLTIAEMESVIKGVIPSRLHQYVGQIAEDGFMQYQRNYIQVVSAGLPNKYYYYSGTTISTTRKFCNTRAARAYTEAEVRAWADLEWDGKNPATTSKTIFTYLGGYRCRHRLLPITEARYKELTK